MAERPQVPPGEGEWPGKVLRLRVPGRGPVGSAERSLLKGD